MSRLEKGKEYFFRVAAENLVGVGEFSELASPVYLGPKACECMCLLSQCCSVNEKLNMES